MWAAALKRNYGLIFGETETELLTLLLYCSSYCFKDDESQTYNAKNSESNINEAKIFFVITTQ